MVSLNTMGETRAGTIDAYCRNCFYVLRGLSSSGKCPECGREFDLSNPKTFTRHPGRRGAWRIVRRPLYGLLALLLLSAGGVGWLYWEWKQEQAVIAWADKRGGGVKTRLIGTGWVPVWAGRYAQLLERVEEVDSGIQPVEAGEFPPAELRWLKTVALRGDGIDDEVMARLGAGGELETIVLDYTRFGDEGLKRLGQQRQLRELVVTSSPITDAGLAALANFPELHDLILIDTQVRGGGLVNLRHVPKLEDLHLRGTGVNDAALAEVGRCAELTFLSLSQTQVTGAGMAHLTSLGKLATLELSNTEVDDTAVEHLAKLTTLKTLWVDQTKLSATGVERLKKALPQTTIHSDFPDPAPNP